MIALGSLDVSALCLGANVFGWTLDEQQSFAVLDAYVAAGGNFIDTADSYPPRAAGLAPGASEEILGAWIAARGNRDEIVLATKVGNIEGNTGLSANQVRSGAEASLRRLATDRIDLYYAHKDDPATPLEETLRAFDALVRGGLVREIGASNYGAERLREGLAISAREGLVRYAALQPHYNLVERGYESELRDVCAAEGVASVPYFGLASGFLTGKYRHGRDVDSVRSKRASEYLASERGPRVLQALDEIAAAHGVAAAAVALAWLASRPTVAAPIASARSPAQLEQLLGFLDLDLSSVELSLLDAASAE